MVDWCHVKLVGMQEDVRASREGAPALLTDADWRAGIASVQVWYNFLTTGATYPELTRSVMHRL